MRGSLLYSHFLTYNKLEKFNFISTLACSSSEEFSGDSTGLKPLLDLVDGAHTIILPTAEDIEVEVACLIAEVSGDVRGGNQLDERIAGLIVFAKSHHLRLAIGLHLEDLYQLTSEAGYRRCVPDVVITSSTIEH